LHTANTATMPAVRVSDEEYALKQTMGPTIQALLKGVCTDLPDQLVPYLLAKLIESFAAAAKDVVAALEPEATQWKKSTVTITEPKQLNKYLEDMRWQPTIQAIFELVCRKRPANAQAFMIELLAKGDPFADIEPAPDSDAAAAKMQALQRGRLERKKQAEKKAAAKAAEDKEQAEAAAKMQAVRRGHADRKAVQAKKLEQENQKKAEQEAAVKMQAMQRGNMARKSASGDAAVAAAPANPAAPEASAPPPEDELAGLPSEAGANPEMDAAAAKLQAAKRGKEARDEYMKQRKERQEAATKMQALQRGKNARKSKA